MEVHDGNAQRGGGAAGARYRIGNVVIFEVQKDRHAHFEEGAHAVRAMGVEKLEAELEATHIGAHTLRQLTSIIGIGGV